MKRKAKEAKRGGGRQARAGSETRSMRQQMMLRQ